jgi:DNA-binding NarL/FixJ family response regulator
VADRAATRYLVVDDNETFLAAARVMLERQGVTVVGAATNGADAIRLAHSLGPDVILVDVDLGGESGFDLARRLAADGAAPAVMISADPEAEFVELVATSPAVGFLSKSALSADAVTRLLRRGRDAAR